MSTAQVLFIDVPDEIMVQRLLHRGKTSGRDDDNAATIKLRLKTFHEQSVPVLDRYNADGKVLNVDGTGSVADVTGAVDREFQPRIMVLSGGASARVHEVGATLADNFGSVYLSVDAIVNAEIALASRAGERLEKMLKVWRRCPSRPSPSLVSTCRTRCCRAVSCSLSWL